MSEKLNIAFKFTGQIKATSEPYVLSVLRMPYGLDLEYEQFTKETDVRIKPGNKLPCYE